jgi:hypothetical protein
MTDSKASTSDRGLESEWTKHTATERGDTQQQNEETMLLDPVGRRDRRIRIRQQQHCRGRVRMMLAPPKNADDVKVKNWKLLYCPAGKNFNNPRVELGSVKGQTN